MNTPMVVIDARMARSSGIGTYLQGLLGAIKKMPSVPFRLSLLGDPSRLPAGPWSVEALSASIYSIREQIELPIACHRLKAALLHSPHYNMSWIEASRSVVTVHDLLHLKFPEFWPSAAARFYSRFFFHHVVPKARAILTVSENTKRDLMDMLSIPESRITVTYPAVDHDRFGQCSADNEADFNRLNLPRDYLLFIGNLKEFKNVPRLVEAYRQVRHRRPDSPDLVLAGRNFIPGFERELAKTPGIRWIGEVQTALLPCLYRHALFFIFPSLYEGFGLPPLEAMASGTPVLCSNTASLPEVVGNAALLVDPKSTEALAEGIETLIQNSALRSELSTKGMAQARLFSWDRMAAQTLEVYRRCLS